MTMGPRSRAFLTLAAFAAVTSASAFAGVAKHPRVPLAFRWPTSVVALSNRALLVVENGGQTAPGRVVRIDRLKGKRTVLLKVDGAYALAHSPSGKIYVSTGKALLRLRRGGVTTTVATSAEDIGPVAVAANGDVYYATETTVFRLDGGHGTPEQVASGFSNPHGLAATADGGLLVSDTGNGTVDRVDVATGDVEKWGDVHEPRGIVFAADGESVYTVDASTHRVVHDMVDGRRLGRVKHVFLDPYALAAAPDGSLYVVDTAHSGRIYRVAPNGKVTVLRR
jgi:sugar lactone lactonase YvrE